jgi:hypothetical protein
MPLREHRSLALGGYWWGVLVGVFLRKENPRPLRGGGYSSDNSDVSLYWRLKGYLGKQYKEYLHHLLGHW